MNTSTRPSPDLTDCLRAIEGYLAAKADRGDALAQGLRQSLLQAYPAAAPDADANLAEAEPLIELTLNVFDDEGIACDTTSALLTQSQCADIVDHAAQVILLRRDLKGFQVVLDELDEALITAGVLAEEELG